jgi:hypothetical protein
LPVVSAVLPEPAEGDEPIVLPEPVEELLLLDGVEALGVLDELDEEPALGAVVEPEAPMVEPLAAAPPPVGVPVAPIGVFCVLRCPAPVAGSLAVVGGVPWAIAVPTIATVARPASMAFSWVEAFMCADS